MEGDDLVVVEIGRDERLRSKLPRDSLEVLARYRLVGQPLQIRIDIVPDRCHDEGIPSQEREVVVNVCRAAAVFAPHLRGEKADVQDMKLIGKKVILEPVREDHDGVVSNRSGNKCAQWRLSS